ncbi:MAG: DUF1828 domain-containing protein [Planctomycetes bacterium]|nr:DUF1828 domain-containing protein [Planctomycetota bacterium]
MITPDRIEQLLKAHSLVRGIDRVPKGHLRIETAFTYPDGSSIEVFLPSEGTYQVSSLSDMGQTISLLLNMQVKPWLSKKRTALLDDAIKPYGVELKGAVLEVPLTSDEALPEAMLRLGQACLRVSDLLFTRRLSLESVFAEEVEEVLVDAELDYTAGVERVVREGRIIRIDFLVIGPRYRSAVLTLAPRQSSQAHVLANELFRKWYDLARAKVRDQRVTVFDDRVDVYRAEDLDRLRDYSTVVGLSEKPMLIELLAAA